MALGLPSCLPTLLYTRDSSAPLAVPCLLAYAQGCLPQLCAHLRSSATLDGFLSELSDVAERLERQRCAAAPPPPAFYQLLLDDIAALGWDRVVLHSQVGNSNSAGGPVGGQSS